MKPSQLQKLVVDAITALDRLVVYRDDHPEVYDMPENIQHALALVEEADGALSSVVEQIP